MDPATSRALIILSLSNEAFTISAYSTDVAAISQSTCIAVYTISSLSLNQWTSQVKIIYLQILENTAPYVGISTMLQGLLVLYLTLYWRSPISVSLILMWPPVSTL